MPITRTGARSEIVSRAYKVIKQAARAGTPVYARPLPGGVLRVEGPNGWDIYKPLPALSPDGELVGVAISTLDGQFRAVVARLTPAGWRSEPWIAVRILAVNERVLTQTMADTWSMRVYTYYSDPLTTVYKEGDFSLLTTTAHLDLILRHDGHQWVIAWHTRTTGITDVSVEWASKWLEVDVKNLKEQVNKFLDFIENRL